MADVTRAPRTKDFGSTSIQCPMLSSTNYTVWSMRMKVLLRVHEVWDTIEPGSDDQKKNDVAIALLFQYVPETLILHTTRKVGYCNTILQLLFFVKNLQKILQIFCNNDHTSQFSHNFIAKS